MKTLTQDDLRQAADLLGVDVPTIQAVAAVESSGSGFLPDGRVILRYEPHIFSRFTKGKFDAKYPDLSYPTWKPGYPTSISNSYVLLEQVAKLDGYNAGISCSFGMFQIMGFNFAACGCKTFREFYRRVSTSEAQQLLLFCQFILTSNLDDELQSRQWAMFALQYNGKQYKRNAYDTKLQAAYERYNHEV